MTRHGPDTCRRHRRAAAVRRLPVPGARRNRAAAPGRAQPRRGGGLRLVAPAAGAGLPPARAPDRDPRRDEARAVPGLVQRLLEQNRDLQRQVDTLTEQAVTYEVGTLWAAAPAEDDQDRWG